MRLSPISQQSKKIIVNSSESFAQAEIVNPKRITGTTSRAESRLFPYYAGYSMDFAERLLNSINEPKSSMVFDPWNGSGTTTQAAHRLGYESAGQDLNPVMVIVAKAGLISALEAPSLNPIAVNIVRGASSRDDNISDDPLYKWISPSGAVFLRRIEREINKVLVSAGSYQNLARADGISQVSPLAAFFYVAIFRATRRLLIDFIPSNPTWVKKPASLVNRKRPTKQAIDALFLDEVKGLERQLSAGVLMHSESFVTSDIFLGSSENIRMKDTSIDVVISSPPYCTRIDYAVATSIELAVLGVGEADFGVLRRSLMGTSTVSVEEDEVSPMWGSACKDFLAKVYSHESKASKTYYYKSHLQYFRSMYLSLGEIARVLKTNGKCILVVQDSFYKDVHNDVARSVIEMSESHGLKGLRVDEFSTGRSMVGINKKAKQYVASRKVTESVLCFEK